MGFTFVGHALEAVIAHGHVCGRLFRKSANERVREIALVLLERPFESVRELKR